MKWIDKKVANEPNALRNYRDTTPNASFGGYVDKDTDTGEKGVLKNALAEEQGYLCCYCMQRIWTEANEINVEHFISQNMHQDSPITYEERRILSLDYGNMLAACNKAGRNCSEIKGNIPMITNPLNKHIIGQIKYRADGEIYSENADIQKDIDKLHLNTFNLKAARNGVINKFRKELLTEKPKGDWSNDIIQRNVEKWLRKIKLKNGKQGYIDFCGAVSYFSKKGK